MLILYLLIGVIWGGVTLWITNDHTETSGVKIATLAVCTIFWPLVAVLYFAIIVDSALHTKKKNQQDSDKKE